jgi:hypothetical protein
VIRLRSLAPALLLCAAGAAHAQSDAPVSKPPPDLYQEALQSISEGRNDDASAILERAVEREPKHAGAWLELALLQCAIGHADQAERLFTVIEQRFAPSQGIRDLIATNRATGCNTWQRHSDLTLVAGRGIDQNVNQGAANARYVIDLPAGQFEYQLSDDFKPRHDQYTMVSGQYTTEVTANGSTGFVQSYARRNDQLHQYDTASVYAGIESPWRFDRWTARSTVSAGVVTLGGRAYERQVQLQGRVTPPLPLPANTQLNLTAAATYSAFPTLANFNNTTLELRGQLAYRSGANAASASLGVLSDHALAERPGGDRIGHFGNLMLRHGFGAHTNAELAFTRQQWDGKLPYSPGLISQVRAQATQVGRATITYAFNSDHALQLEGRVVRNRENISIFQYNDRQLQLSWLWHRP